MVKVGDVYNEYVDGTHWADWKVINTGTCIAIECIKAYNEQSIPVKHRQVTDLFTIETWVKQGWFVLDKENRVLDLLRKIDEIGG